jgi:hypothetical protein
MSRVMIIGVPTPRSAATSFSQEAALETGYRRRSGASKTLEHINNASPLQEANTANAGV